MKRLSSAMTGGVMGATFAVFEKKKDEAGALVPEDTGCIFLPSAKLLRKFFIPHATPSPPPKPHRVYLSAFFYRVPTFAKNLRGSFGFGRKTQPVEDYAKTPAYCCGAHNLSFIPSVIMRKVWDLPPGAGALQRGPATAPSSDGGNTTVSADGELLVSEHVAGLLSKKSIEKVFEENMRGNELQPVRILILRDSRRQKDATGAEGIMNEILGRYIDQISKEYELPVLSSSADMLKLQRGHSTSAVSQATFKYRGYILETSLNYDGCTSLFMQDKHILTDLPDTGEAPPEELLPRLVVVGKLEDGRKKYAKLTKRRIVRPDAPKLVISFKKGADELAEEAEARSRLSEGGGASTMGGSSSGGPTSRKSVVPSMAGQTPKAGGGARGSMFFMDSSEEFFEHDVGARILFLRAPSGTSSKHELGQLDSIRIYLDGMNVRPSGVAGRALNYNMAREEKMRLDALAEKEAAERRARERAAAQGRSDELDGDVETPAEQGFDPQMMERRARLTKTETQRAPFLKASLARAREVSEMAVFDEYLQKHVLPSLTPALIAVARCRPSDPVGYLADLLEKSVPRPDRPAGWEARGDRL